MLRSTSQGAVIARSYSQIDLGFQGDDHPKRLPLHYTRTAMRRSLVLLRVMLLAFTLPVAAQTEHSLPQPAAEDSSLVQWAQTYARAWLLADSSAMAEAIHPAARRQIVHTIDGAVILEEQDAATMCAAAGELTPQPGATSSVRIRVLESDSSTAIVRIDLPLWTERVTFVRWNDAWKVTHSAWSLTSAPPSDAHAH